MGFVLHGNVPASFYTVANVSRLQLNFSRNQGIVSALSDARPTSQIFQHNDLVVKLKVFDNLSPSTISSPYEKREVQVDFRGYRYTLFCHRPDQFPASISGILKSAEDFFDKTCQKIIAGQGHAAFYINKLDKAAFSRKCKLEIAIIRTAATEVMQADSSSLAWDPAAILEFSAEIDTRNVASVRDVSHSRVADYRDSSNGLFPLRDMDGSHLKICSVAHHPSDDMSNMVIEDVFHVKEIMRFMVPSPYDASLQLEKEMHGETMCLEILRQFPSPEKRRWSYENRMLCRRITRSDSLRPDEKSLIGQYGVFARQYIPKNTCLGIYGGFVLGNELFMSDCVPPSPYLLGSKKCEKDQLAGKFGHVVDGDNVLSRINTTYHYRNGKAVAEDREACNVAPYRYRVELQDQRNLDVTCYFAVRDIPAGTELRARYGLHDMNSGEPTIRADKPHASDHRDEVQENHSKPFERRIFSQSVFDWGKPAYSVPQGKHDSSKS